MGICFAQATAAQEEPPGKYPAVGPSEIKGTVQINGWTGNGSDIKIRAVPMGITSSDGRRFTPDPRATVMTATLKGTANPHRFRFAIMGLQPATLYRLVE